MNRLRAILVEDEPSGMENLRWKLENNCPNVEIIAECGSGQEAIQAIRRDLPDLLFLDIMLGDMTGFEVLQSIKHQTFDLIFTTSYDEFALDAIKSSAVDYLLKPIQIEELQEAVAKVNSKRMEQTGGGNVPAPAAPTRIGFPVPTGTQFFEMKDIIYARADDNVAILRAVDKKEDIRLTKSLGWVEEKLAQAGFCRIHHSYLINLNHLAEYIRNDGGYAVMTDGKAISISRRRKDDFLQQLKAYQENY